MNDVYLVNASKKDAVAAIKAAGNTLRMVVARPGSGVDATSSGASKGYGRATATARAGSQGAGHVGASGDDVAGEVDRLAQSLKEKEREAEGLRARHKSLLEQHDKHLAAPTMAGQFLTQIYGYESQFSRVPLAVHDLAASRAFLCI